MDRKLDVIKGQLTKLGVHKVDGGLSIVSDISGKNSCGIILYVDGATHKIPFVKAYLINGLYCLYIKDFDYDQFDYIFYKDDEKITDPYAKLLDSSKKFGDAGRKNKVSKCCYRDDLFAWEGDIQPEIPYHDAIIYKIHMRGFTRHSSSEVEHKGTFSGLKEKIPYLKELGITTIETMPIVEFEDVIYNPAYEKIDDALLPFLDEKESMWQSKVNFWGYTNANYMAPKRAYASSDRPDIELKELIKELHKNGLELVMDFYFPPSVYAGFILDVCRFWVKEYHVDGFKLMGCNIPVSLLVEDPYLKHTKLIFEALGDVTISSGSGHKNVAVMSGGFLYDIRKYLKGDEDMLRSVTSHFRENPKDFAIINEITSYQGFTLADLVSYDRKHNELNGENNHDGSDYNYSWNCGAEGKTRKKAILSLRAQQRKNALLMLLTSQGTPVLLAGDEFGNSADGNNNPYCQDNAVSWLNWKMSTIDASIYEFTKELIKYRRKHPILHKEDALRQSDYISAGYPDISYHSDQAWYAGFENYNRHIGIMYCGKYAKVDRRNDDDFIYVAYNTHWIDHDFALPKLPDELKWSIQIVTCDDKRVVLTQDKEQGRGDSVLLPPRSMAILSSIEKDVTELVKVSETGLGIETESDRIDTENKTAQ